MKYIQKHKKLNTILFIAVSVIVPMLGLFGNNKTVFASPAPNGCYQHDTSVPSPNYFLDNTLCTNPPDSTVTPIKDPSAGCYIQTLSAKSGENSPFVAGACPDSSKVTSISLTSGGTAPAYGCGSNGVDQQNNVLKGFIATSIDFGCKGDACVKSTSTDVYCGTYHNGVTDLIFAIIRFLSAGVGIIVVGSIILGGIQYTTSQDNPQATSAAIARIRSSLIALLIFIFSYAILNYLIPIGFFNQ